MTRARENADGARLDAPLASPTFTGTVGGLGTPVINLGSATGAIPAGVTGGAGLTGSTSLGTVTAGTLSHGTTLQGYVDASNTGVTFPAGHISKVFRFNETPDGSTYENAGTAMVNMTTPISWTTVSGRHYFISTSIYVAPYMETSVSSIATYQQNEMWYGLVNRTRGATSTGSPDILLSRAIIGHHHPAGSVSGTSNTYGMFSPNGQFTAGSSAPHYMYITAQPYSGAITARTGSSSTNPWTTIIFEVMP